MEKIKIDMFSNLKIGDKFKLNKGGFIVYEKTCNNKMKEVANILNNSIDAVDKTILDDKLFCVVYPV